MLSRRSTELNHVLSSDVGEDVLYSGEQTMFISVVMWLNPFAFQYSPKSLGNIEMRRIWRQIEYMETSFFPSFKTILDFATFVDAGVIQNHNSLFGDSKREVVHEFYKLVGVDIVLSGEAVIHAVAVYHTEDVEPSAFVYGNAKLLVFEFPRIGYIPFCTNMAFITIIEVNETVFPLMFKLLQEFLLVCVLLRRGVPFGRFPYTSKSCAREDKKFRKAPSLICLPVASIQASLALETLWRCCLIASFTASLSALVLMIRLRPLPPLFFRPSIPCSKKRLTQCGTRWYVCPARAPAAALLNPSALPKTIRHRIRNEWVDPFRYPFSKDALCSFVIFIFVACLDIFGEISVCKTITFENGFHCVNFLIRHTYVAKLMLCTAKCVSCGY